jgi:hypothetical protein
MSLNLIKKNSSSPFHLQRSIVPQTEGAYQDGGYNPSAVYNNDAANEAVESFSKTVGAALSNANFSKKKKPINEEAKKEKAKEIVSNAMGNAFDPLGINKIKKNGQKVVDTVTNAIDPLGVKKAIKRGEENKKILSDFSEYENRGI